MSAPETLATFTSDDVVKLAEAADGTRGQTLYVVQENGEFVLKEELEPGDQCLFKVSTRHELGRRLPAEVTIASPGGDSLSLGGFDSVFWTESAAEKFLWPYYHSHRIYTEDVRGCHARFREKRNIIAVAHVPPTRSIAIETSKLVVRKPDNSVAVMTFDAYEEWVRTQPAAR